MSTNSFLDRLAAVLWENYGSDMQQVRVVLPTRRAGLYLRESLLRQFQKAMWAPECLTPSSIFYEASQLEEAGELELITILHTEHKRISNSPESISSFFSWGDLLLKDFDSIDKSLADARTLFTRIRSEKELETLFPAVDPELKNRILKFWTGFEPSPSDMQLKFLKLWEILPDLYQAFGEILVNQGIGYNGLIQRRIVESGFIGIPNNKPVWIAGFNWLSACEQALFSHFHKGGLARFVWDIEKEWIDNPEDLRGKYIRTHYLKWGGEIFESETPAPKIIHTGVNLSEGMATLLANDVSQSQTPPDRQAIVFPKEQLLLPVLHALPAETKPVNLSLGFPLRRSLLFEFIQLLRELSGPTGFRGKGYEPELWLRLLAHPLGGGVWRKKATEWDQKIRKNGVPFITKQDIETHFPDMKLLDQFIQNPIHRLPALCEWLGKINGLQPIEQAALRFGSNQIRNLYALLERQYLLAELDAGALWKLLRQVIQRSRVPFLGEPIQGMQMMGIIESQALDYETLYLLNINEDSWPSAPSQSGIIPFHLRRIFGLPLPEDQLNQETYLFYRMIRRAKTVYLYSNQIRINNDRAELSRFVDKLRIFDGYPIQERRQKPGSLHFFRNNITVEKTGVIQEKLLEIRSKGISPTHIGNYLHCSLRFYFQHICKLEETFDVTRDLDARVLGNLVHNAIEWLYKPIFEQNLLINKSDLEQLQKREQLELALEHAFRKQYKLPADHKPEFRGEWLIIKEVVFKYLQFLLKQESKHLPVQLLGIEVKKEIELQLSDQKPAKIIGFVDRIDAVSEGKITRVLDYKTGDPAGKMRIKSMDLLFSGEKKSASKEVIQVLLYCWMLSKEGNAGIIQPGLLFVRSYANEELDFRIKIMDKTGVPDGTTDENGFIEDVRPLLPAVENGLRNLLDEIFDFSRPFVQTDDPEQCAICPFKEICQR